MVNKIDGFRNRGRFVFFLDVYIFEPEFQQELCVQVKKPDQKTRLFSRNKIQINSFLVMIGCSALSFNHEEAQTQTNRSNNRS